MIVSGTDYRLARWHGHGDGFAAATDDPGLSITGWAYGHRRHFQRRASASLEVPYDSTGIDLSTVDAAVNNPVLPILRGAKGDQGDPGLSAPGAEQRRHRDFQRVGVLPVDYFRLATTLHAARSRENIASWNFTGPRQRARALPSAFLFTQRHPTTPSHGPRPSIGSGVIAPTAHWCRLALILVLTSFDGGVIWDATARIRGALKNDLPAHASDPAASPRQRPAAVQRKPCTGSGIPGGWHGRSPPLRQ